MSYTASDLTSVETAIVSFARGARVVSVSIGDKMIQYGKAELSELLKLRADMQMELGSFPARTYAKQGGRSR